MPFFKRADPPLIKLENVAVAELCKKAKLEPAAAALLIPGQTPAEFLAILEKNNLAGEASKFLAHALPEREAVWWACQAARRVEIALNSAEKAALAAAEAWVRGPRVDTRAAAAEAAKNTDMTGPAAWAAQAAAWAPLPAVVLLKPEPTAELAAPAVAGAILLAGGLVGKPPMPEVQAPALPSASMPGVTAPAAPGLAQPALPGAPSIGAPKMAAMPAAPVMPARPGMPAIHPPGAIPLPKPAGPAAPQIAAPGVPAVAAPGGVALPAINPAVPGVAAPTMPTVKVPPLDQKKLAKMLKSFLELGRQVASGENSWG